MTFQLFQFFSFYEFMTLILALKVQLHSSKWRNCKYSISIMPFVMCHYTHINIHIFLSYGLCESCWCFVGSDSCHVPVDCWLAAWLHCRHEVGEAWRAHGVEGWRDDLLWNCKQYVSCKGFIPLIELQQIELPGGKGARVFWLLHFYLFFFVSLILCCSCLWENDLLHKAFC